MSNDDQARWDKQHAESGGAEQPSSFLRDIFKSDHWEISRGRALDIACGKGRNALFLADQGFEVVAMDVSPVALEEGRRRAQEKSLPIAWQQADLEQIRLAKNSFELVINFNYLQRSLIAQLKTALKSGGHMIFETYLIDQQAIGHPKNLDYLLAHNELLRYFREFRVLYYREGKFSDGREPSFRSGILARKSG
ncbi:MAG TPA: class I SAM-dependent methyltransferase [Candidatus Limnocylindria bacterium]|nr:class I SAM-dependent methyltransferase [Candidatus Limnocylindria bacterium]